MKTSGKEPRNCVVLIDPDTGISVKGGITPKDLDYPQIKSIAFGTAQTDLTMDIIERAFGKDGKTNLDIVVNDEAWIDGTPHKTAIASIGALDGKPEKGIEVILGKCMICSHDRAGASIPLTKKEANVVMSSVRKVAALKSVSSEIGDANVVCGSVLAYDF
jgi:hypothetical protein